MHTVITQDFRDGATMAASIVAAHGLEDAEKWAEKMTARSSDEFSHGIRFHLDTAWYGEGVRR